MSRGPLAGVDGCRAGWILVRADALGAPVAHRLCADARELLAAAGEDTTIAIDIPIGLADADAREADRLARRALGARGSSVFPAPPRAALAARTYDEAKAIARAATGRAVTLQAFHLLGRIRDVDAALRADPRLAARVHEVHPELSFRELNGGVPMAHAKKVPPGRRERMALVERAFPGAFAHVRRACRAADVGGDDILDALAALWSAARIRDGRALALPPGAPPRDAMGLPMRISA